MELESILLPGVDAKRPLIIAGPCSAETEEQVMETARALAARGIKIFRAGIWKPRTKPGGFEGNGVKALPWLKRVKTELGMYTAVEVATAAHVREALAYDVDMLWIGARTSANPFAVQEVADALEGMDIPLVKPAACAAALSLSPWSLASTNLACFSVTADRGLGICHIVSV
jgi:chorismate mutase